MKGALEASPPSNGWKKELSGGWPAYREAIDLLRRDDRPLALRLLAEAETAFGSSDDQQGLWRALAGQTAAHWHAGDAALALARATAALRAAGAAGDRTGVSVVAWQLAVLHLHHDDYHRSALSLAQLQEALGPGVAAAGVAACGHLCREIGRWHEMAAGQVVAQHTAAQVVVAVQRDLAGHLARAAAALRALWRELSPVDDIEQLLLLPAADSPLVRLAAAPSLRARISRWWHALTTSPQPPQPPAIEPASPLPPAPRIAPPAQGPPTIIDVEPPPAPEPQARRDARLAVSCFGRFRVLLDDRPLERWESARGRTIFKYLVTRRGAAVPKELLADMFWPDSEPELARRSLHQAIYCLRQSFKRLDAGLAVVLFSDDCYQINPALSAWVDGEAFGEAIAQAQAHAAAGQTAEAMRAYAVAVDLAGGEFLEEDRYEPWAEELRQSYAAMLTEALRRLSGYHLERGDYPTAVAFGQRLLAQESCDEDAHLTLMRCYLAQGLRHLAVRQYQICAANLKSELGLTPSDEIEAFYQQVVLVA